MCRPITVIEPASKPTCILALFQYSMYLYLELLGVRVIYLELLINFVFNRVQSTIGLVQTNFVSSPAYFNLAFVGLLVLTRTA